MTWIISSTACSFLIGFLIGRYKLPYNPTFALCKRLEKTIAKVKGVNAEVKRKDQENEE